MKKLIDWKPVIEKFHKRLSDWKARTISFGGRLTLVKSVLNSLPLYYFSIYRAPSCVIKKLECVRRNFYWGGNIDDKKISWVNWEKLLLPYEEGGLNIGSLKGKNLALLGKWRWRFHTEINSLWTKIITSIYGSHGGFDSDDSHRHSPPHGSWFNVINAGKTLDSLAWRLAKVQRCRKDSREMEADVRSHWGWSRSPTGRALGELETLSNLINSFVFDHSETDADSWRWKIAPNGKFTTEVLNETIEGKFNEGRSLHMETERNYLTPKKIEIFIWRARLRRLAVRVELDKRGVDLHSVL
ncbi:uncharacterized protein [Rutidosis leptorrhynchoides]|uniref:uncharacterized protein n=1 Tax=Rutidosis leptorrhynchoides TaxID=125765 RepID=UPI003A992AF6